MLKKLFLLSLVFVFTGCVNSLALLGPASSAANGKVVQSSFNSLVSYGIKKQTGKTPYEHAVDNLEELNKTNKLGFID